ncbi:MAG: hypothetical protein ACI39N_07870 [Lachnospiraceae bacterium]
MERTFSLDGDNEYLAKTYREYDNYKEIVINEDKKTCYIFFSGNGLYYPNTVEEFEKTVIQNDRYEWIRTTESELFRNHAGKVILVRDIYKSWYQAGININEDSIEKVCRLLEKLMKGYEVITCGNSAGGYMAVIAGVWLNAKVIFNFGGQCSLIKSFKDFSDKNRKFIEEQSKKNEGKWLDIIEWSIRNLKTPIMWFYAGKCPRDIQQIEEFKKKSEGMEQFKNLKFFSINSDTHGFYLLSGNAEWIICKDIKELVELSEHYKGKLINMRILAIKTMPFHDAVSAIKKDLARCHRSLRFLVSTK